MKHINIFILLLFLNAVVLGQKALYLIPEPIKIESSNKCFISDELIQKAKNIVQGNMMPSNIEIRSIQKIDLNNDDTCELLIKYFDGSAYTQIRLFKIFNGEIKDIGEFSEETIWFGDYKNGYPQIIQTYYEGEKTNPTLYVRIYYFNNEKYVIGSDPHITRGQYMDEGLKAYKLKNYDLAEKYFHNAFNMPHWLSPQKLFDANNLALVWINQGKLDQSLNLLLKVLNEKSEEYYDHKSIASTYYNLGLIEEKKLDYNKAFEYYTKSNSFESNDARVNKVKEIEKKIKK